MLARARLPAPTPPLTLDKEPVQGLLHECLERRQAGVAQQPVEVLVLQCVERELSNEGGGKGNPLLSLLLWRCVVHAGTPERLPPLVSHQDHLLAHARRRVVELPGRAGGEGAGDGGLQEVLQIGSWVRCSPQGSGPFTSSAAQ